MADNLVFGLHAVEALLHKRPGQIDRLQVQQGREDKRLRALLDLARQRDIPVEVVPRADLDHAVSGRHQGVIALLKADRQANEADLWQLLDQLDADPFLLILDGVTDPHNLGACLRSANAAGVHAVVVPKDKSAPLTPVARKVACGAAEFTPLIRVTNLARTLDQLKERGIWLVGTAGEAEQLLWEQDLRGPLVLIMGAEDKGMRRLTREACDHLVRLPMAGEVTSLNVSVATGVCLFEAVRQRLA
ncbi:23S rRNA (guanosine(2251)-2'-O)-methyltransferase RlmB [Hahella sp. SMD15-11]|uniref:23S rRNA (guanosine-2'-O-)-methyltransferase RlmB n=1 Tax=Thermohahella caldifontis TaxID=3142973 RepID=A0AB39UW54_9GAMM